MNVNHFELKKTAMLFFDFLNGYVPEPEPGKPRVLKPWIQNAVRLGKAARAAGLQAWDVPFLGLDDPDGLVDETRRVIALGFSCKTAIHPKQLAPVLAAFEPAPELLAWARAVLAAQADAAAGAFIFQGKLVDAPIIKRAERIVELAVLGARR